MKCNITEQLDDIAAEFGAEKAASDNIVEALEKIRVAVSNGGGGGNSSVTDWPLSDRMDKGTGDYAVIEGHIVDYQDPSVTHVKNQANGSYSHAEGYNTVADKYASHAEGEFNVASGVASHVEGLNTQATAMGSHAEGKETTASGNYSHAEGSGPIASGYYSHAEGGHTTASGSGSHAEGSNTIASGAYSHAEGSGTIAKNSTQHVFGSYNIQDPSSDGPNVSGTYIEIVGNGTTNSNRSNARTLDWNGNEVLAGSLTLGMGTADEVTITAAQLKELLLLLN